MKLEKTDSIAKRRKKVEEFAAVSLKHSASGTLDEVKASTRHCEQMIGVTQVPLGVAGPIPVIHSSGAKKEYLLPLATTEGALVASINRGCKAIRESGGVRADAESVGATRGPVFAVNDLAAGKKLQRYIETQKTKFQKIVQKTSSHTVLRDVKCRLIGSYCFVRFVFDTGDAMGLNMVTIASDALVRYIEQQTGVFCIALSGNYCVDKKPAWMNILSGRGMQVNAEVLLPKEVVQTTLKTTAQNFFDVWLSKCMIGSAVSGAMGQNAQFANVLAALFLATGQDLAHIGECSVGTTIAELRGEDLYVSVAMPDMMCGTVGGGTELETQKEALSILGISGGNDGKHKVQFAEIIGAAVLAGEISLLASLAEQSLALAHQRLARGKNI